MGRPPHLRSPATTPLRRACGVAAGRRRQRGLGLLETMFLVLLIGGALLAAFVHLRSEAPRRQAEAQAAALAWADHALIGFAAANARLPCPATQPDGVEDCSGSLAKGWLPVATLSLLAANPGPGTLPMGYVVYRGGGGSDLVQLTDQFNPHGWNGSFYATFGALNGLDFCVALTQAAANPASTGQAYFSGAGGAVNVAYGIVAASPLGGSGASLFDGVNIGSGVQVEAPSRGLTPDYGDRVRVRDFATLSAALNCNHMLASLDGMALAADVADEVASQKESIKNSATLLAVINAAKMVVQIIKVVLSAISIGTAVATLTAAVAALTSAIAGCVFLVGCALIPAAAAAVAAAAAAIVSAGIAVALNAGAVVAHAVAIGQTAVVAVEAGGSFADVDTATLAEAVSAAHDAAIEADRAAVKARNDYNSAVTKRDAALVSANETWAALLDYSHTRDPDGAWDPLFEAFRQSLTDYFAAQQAQAAAVSARNAANKRIADLADALVAARNDYAAKTAAWAAETDPDIRKRREMEMFAARDAVAAIEQEQGVAAAELVSATLAEQQANTGVSTAATARATARAALLAKFTNFIDNLIVGSGLDQFESRYKDYIGKRDLVERQLKVLTTAEDNARDAWAGYNALLAMQSGSAPPGSSEIGIGTNQREILEAADQRGAVR